MKMTWAATERNGEGMMTAGHPCTTIECGPHLAMDLRLWIGDQTTQNTFAVSLTSHPHHHPYPPPHTRYYEGPPPTYRGREESRSSRSDYHREVEEFLRRTADRPRERDRDRRHRR